MGWKTKTDKGTMSTVDRLKQEKIDLENEKEITNSQEKLDFLDDQIYEIEDSLKKLGVVNVWPKI